MCVNDQTVTLQKTVCLEKMWTSRHFFCHTAGAVFHLDQNAQGAKKGWS